MTPSIIMEKTVKISLLLRRLLKSYQKECFLLSLIFLFSFLWLFSLTYNFPLFWEDSAYLTSYKNYMKYPVNYTLSTFSSHAVDIFIAPEQLYKVSYNWRDLERLFYSPFVIAALGFQPLLFRVIKIFIFAGLATLYFAFTSFQKRVSILFSLLLLSYFLVLPESWITALYLADTLTYTLLFSTIALTLFYWFYNDDSLQNPFLIFFLFVAIVFFTRLSVLLQHIGRVNFLLFFLLLLFTAPKKLLRFRYWSLLLSLFLISVPVLGILRVFSGEPILSTIGLTEQSGVTTGNLFATAFTFITTVYLTFLPHAVFLAVPFFLFILLHGYAIFLGKEQGGVITCCAPLKTLTIFSFLWFLFNTGMLFFARGFVFDPGFFLRFEFTLFLFSQALFLISYCMYVYKRYFSSRKILYYVLLFFVLLSIFHNVSRLNEWRGGWGAYFLGYNTVRQYVDDNAEHAILLLPMDHASPVYFSPESTNTHAMVADLTNASVIRGYAANYSTVYVANRGPMAFNDPSIVTVANLTVVDTSPYGYFKKAIGRYYNTPFYLYKLIY